MRITVIDRGRYQLVLAPEKPCWAAVNREAAQLVVDLADQGTVETWIHYWATRNGLTPTEAEQVVKGCAAETAPVWSGSVHGSYEGRGVYLRPACLRELWIHLNNRCNFTCRHCLVSSGPHREDGLPSETVARLLQEARELGVVTFFFTGGEPLLRPDLPRFLRQILEDPEAHAVVLTNGSLIQPKFLEAVADLDRDRLHWQVSLDGSTPDLNDRLRSPGAFERATAGIRRAIAAGLETTVSTVVLDANLHDLPAIARLLPQLGVPSWHLMWPHLRERGATVPVADVERLTQAVLELKPVADQAGVRIDNFENFKAILNGEPGTKRDGTNACWDSLALYTDGGVFPSAALVGIEKFRGGNVLDQPLREIWLKSKVFEDYRRRSVISSASVQDDPFLFLHGGGDPEHAYFFGQGDPTAKDPYLPLYRALMLAVADEVVAERMELLGARDDVPLTYHVMGQDGLGCPVHAGVENRGPHRIDFIHSNCVLIPDVVGYARQIVQDFYGEAALEVKCEVCCPVSVDRRYWKHIPPAVLERSYGCGSPLLSAALAEGETLVDLGSGAGIDCFAASKMVGPTGLVIGVDMTPEMLAFAHASREEVARTLGYGNVQFVRGYLEGIPVRSESVDVVTSNCVINLSPQKLRVFSEIRRILKPGGRLVMADITAGGEVPEHVKFNPRLKAECVGGALRREELLFLLTKVGFVDIRLLDEQRWREIAGAEFYADTLMAVKPEPGRKPLPYVGIQRPERRG